MKPQKLLSLILILFMILGVVKSTKAQTIITLQPDAQEGKDAKIWDLNPNTNYGTDIHYSAWAWTWSGSPGAARGLIEFDLSSIPLGATITEAKLSLFYAISTSQGQAGSNETYLRRIIEPWSENTVTWNTQPATTAQNQVYLPSSTYQDQDYPDIDVTDLVQDMIDNPGSSHGIMIQLITEVEYRSMKFASSDYSNAAKHPKMEITFTGVGVGPSQAINDVKVYPNPFTDNFSIDINGVLKGNAQLRIMDAVGRVIFDENQNFSGSVETLNISSLNQNMPTGIYFLEIICEGNTYKFKLLKG